MNQIESLENNRVKITFGVGPDRFEEGLKHSYNKNKGGIFISGFRKGKAPRKIIETQYGKEVFYEDAFDFVLPDAYSGAIKDLKLRPVSKPENLDIMDVSVENGVVFTAELTVRPKAEIQDYSGLTYMTPDKTVTDDDIYRSLEQDREKNARLISVDRPIENNDTVTLDFEGFIDEVAFEGGKGENYELVIGSHRFIDTFEEQLIGHSVGDDVDVNVMFPEDYDNVDYAGKQALFKVEIKDIRIKELPELDDDFAQDVSEFDTLEELKEDIRRKLAVEKERRAHDEIDNQLIDQLIEKVIVDVPEIMYESEIDNMMRTFSQQLAYQGISLEVYAQSMGITMSTLRQMYAGEAQRRVKSSLALEAVAISEGIEITDEDLQNEINNIAEQYKMDPENFTKMLQEGEIESINESLMERKSLEFIRSTAVETTEFSDAAAIIDGEPVEQVTIE